MFRPPPPFCWCFFTPNRQREAKCENIKFIMYYSSVSSPTQVTEHAFQLSMLYICCEAQHCLSMDCALPSRKTTKRKIKERHLQSQWTHTSVLPSHLPDGRHFRLRAGDKKVSQRAHLGISPPKYKPPGLIFGGIFKALSEVFLFRDVLFLAGRLKCSPTKSAHTIIMPHFAQISPFSGKSSADGHFFDKNLKTIT